ncbi:hypothetical protein J2Z31_002858 [Sinorhizobium kostiense]|uniref:Transposase n=1 Tax=Sinorhizobium kostiense TaxID=76747 RepID=A0ABS4R0X4_9HYPH|nr:hypothetical protein [Sinorhizobium kostiense]
MGNRYLNEKWTSLTDEVKVRDHVAKIVVLDLSAIKPHLHCFRKQSPLFSENDYSLRQQQTKFCSDYLLR